MQRMLSRLSPQQLDALKQFQSIVAPASPDLIAACWFLKSEKWEPPEGARAYQSSMEWRASRGIDKLLRAPSPFSEEVQGILDEVFALRLLKCCDLRGRPVLYVPYRHIDIPTLAKRGITQEHLVQRCILTLSIWLGCSSDFAAGCLQVSVGDGEASSCHPCVTGSPCWPPDDRGRRWGHAAPFHALALLLR